MRTAITILASSAMVLALGSSQAKAHYPPYYPSYPQYPVIVTPSQITSFNPWTGGVNTAGSTIYNSAFDPFRQASLYNGSAHMVNQPIYGPGGNIIGWRQGTAWTNSVTGQRHFDGQVITPNGMGGYNSEHVMKAVRPRPR